MSLTDIFARRYKDVIIWENFEERAEILYRQGFLIVKEDLFPLEYENEYEKSKAQKQWEGLWNDLNKDLARELGLSDLSSPATLHTPVFTYPKVTVCENFIYAKYTGSVLADRFIKERLSFVELAFRKKGKQVADNNARFDKQINKTQTRSLNTHEILTARKVTYEKYKQDIRVETQKIKNQKEKMNKSFLDACSELNERFKQAGVNLNYHNGFIQISRDALTTDQIERPFWDLVSTGKWANVDEEMKTAIDLHDTSGPDPAWYAAKALESTIKIICNEKRWTRGKENGPHNWLDNLLAEKNGHFINKWECNILKGFFTNVRNPSAHGAGNDKISKLEHWQTDWAIEFCMSWIKNLIRRM